MYCQLQSVCIYVYHVQNKGYLLTYLILLENLQNFHANQTSYTYFVAVFTELIA